MSQLIRTCALLWLLGLVGMWILRVGLDNGPGELAFDLFTRLWVIGGIGYLVLGAIGLANEHEHAA